MQLISKERRASPRTKCKFALTYRALEESEFQPACDNFSLKRQRIVLYDQLVRANKKQNFKLQTLKNELTPILDGLNEQMKLLIDTLSLDFDVLHTQEVLDVVINLGGMLFHSKEIIATGKIVELQLRLEVGTPRILVLSEVLRSELSEDNETISTIVSFTYVEAEDKEVLKDYTELQVRNGAQVL